MKIKFFVTKESFNCGFNSEPIELSIYTLFGLDEIRRSSWTSIEKEQFYERDRKNQVINSEFNSKSTGA